MQLENLYTINSRTHWQSQVLYSLHVFYKLQNQRKTEKLWIGVMKSLHTFGAVVKLPPRME